MAVVSRCFLGRSMLLCAWSQQDEVDCVTDIDSPGFALNNSTEGAPSSAKPGVLHMRDRSDCFEILRGQAHDEGASSHGSINNVMLTKGHEAQYARGLWCTKTGYDCDDLNSSASSSLVWVLLLVIPSPVLSLLRMVALSVPVSVIAMQSSRRLHRY
ncbi:hypothetical protein SISSUDRAFT_1055645 [Sistotremastrum suecicum HHB10207 ss-3]|uniref:Uncharacterized protein n=1 Tax=Sistotremastrum suecicum HHB10207 ss-3 TaxID=1314776 RepID=A0A165XMM0_9AGAM|nr:hypothetical protein SISSUDRAFT_1055645 [Sistotremastrum suecicum HHB10207 ss-3]